MSERMLGRLVAFRIPGLVAVIATTALIAWAWWAIRGALAQGHQTSILGQVTDEGGVATTIGFGEILGLLAFATTWPIALMTILFAFFGRPQIEAEIERRVRDKSERLAKELWAGSRVGLSYVYGELGLYNNKYLSLTELISPDNIAAKSIKIELKQANNRFLNLAADMSRTAYDVLDDQSELGLTALNNFVYYSTVADAVTHIHAAVDCAIKLRQTVSQSGDLDSMTTYAAVVAKWYSDFPAPRIAVNGAIRDMRRLIRNSHVSPYHQENAKRHLAALRFAASRLR